MYKRQADWSVVKWDGKKLAKKEDKLAKIALGAADVYKRQVEGAALDLAVENAEIVELPAEMVEEMCIRDSVSSCREMLG